MGVNHSLWTSAAQRALAKQCCSLAGFTGARTQAVCTESVLHPEPERVQYERTPDNDAQEISAVSPTERSCTCGDGGLLKKFSYVVFFLSLSMFLRR